jgi:hypothetical protein
VDTLPDNFQIHNPIFRNYISAATLGNYGLPASSNVFSQRNYDQEFVVINSFFPFMKFPENKTYFNTRKPFTQICYIKELQPEQGGNSGRLPYPEPYQNPERGTALYYRGGNRTIPVSES